MFVCLQREFYFVAKVPDIKLSLFYKISGVEILASKQILVEYIERLYNVVGLPQLLQTIRSNTIIRYDSTFPK